MTIGSFDRKFAEETSATITLQEVLGGYELVFAASGVLHADPAPRWFAIHAARIALRTPTGNKVLGAARSENLVEVVQPPQYAGRFAFELKLQLSPHQLNAIEDCRGSADLDFQITLACTGGELGKAEQPHTEDLYKRVTESDWVNQLKRANARDILLLEVALPRIGAAEERKAAFVQIKRAHELFLDGRYTECVVACRKGIEEFEKGLSAVPWKSLTTLEDRKKLSKPDRLRVLSGTLHLLMQLAAHSDSQGGVEYDRSEARLVLAMLSAYSTHLSGP